MDDALRDLERRAAQGEPGAAEALLQAQLRAGSAPVVFPEGWHSGSSDPLVAEWTVGVGDHVRKDQVLAHVELDKVSLELTAPIDGAVASLEVPELQQGKPGAVFLRLEPPAPGDPEDEARHRALLDAILSAPEDAVARLEYADFLTSLGARGRGVFRWGPDTALLRGRTIRAFHEGRASTADRARLDQTARDLLPVPCPRGVIEGGFLVGVDETGTWVARHWEALVSSAPITRLALHDVKDAAPLLRLPRLEQVRVLALGPWVEPSAVEALAGAGPLRPQRLVLRDVDALPALAALGARDLVLDGAPPPAWLAGSSVERVEVDLSVPDLDAARALLAAIPPSVRQVAPFLRLARAERVPVEVLRPLLGERYDPASRAWTLR